jgi:hypothetical protein
VPNGNEGGQCLKTMPPHSKYFQFLTDAVEKVGSEPSSRNN